LCRSVDSAAMLIGQHNQYSGTINLAAQSTLWQDPHSGSQQASTINTLSAQSTLQHHHQSGPVNTPAQSTLRHHYQSGTVIISAQSYLRACLTWTAHSKSLSLHCVHFSSSPATSNPSAGVCIWTTHQRQFLLKADATCVSFSSFSVSTVGSILMHVGHPREYFLLCRSCPSEGAWWAVLECRSCRSVDYASLFVVLEF